MCMTESRMSSYGNAVAKVYNDKITFTRYEPHKIRYKYFNELYKVCLETGDLFPWCFADTLAAHKSFEASLCRSLNRIYELSDKNVFTHFITVTFNETYVSRKSAFDVHAVFKRLIKRFRYKYGDFGYIAVPEFHKDNAIHYHCLFVFHGKRPRLRYRGRTKKGQPYFEITDKFFKSDCFITVELLKDGNNIDYLTKYMTKGNEKPLYRRFSCSRNLKRSRLVRAVPLPAEYFGLFSRVAKSRGFKLHALNRHVTSYIYDLKRCGGDSGGEAAASPDSSILNTKGEKGFDTDAFFESLLKEFDIERRLRRENVAEYIVNGEIIRVGGNDQLRFLFS